MPDGANAGARDGQGASDEARRPLPTPPAQRTPTTVIQTSTPHTRFDGFLSHNSADKPVVERLAEQLRARGLRPWLDKWALVAGADWQDGLAAGLRDSLSCAVFLGHADVGPWQRPEVKVA